MSTSQPSGPGRPRIFGTPFAAIYPLYVAKAERKGRTADEVDRVIAWLTGYDRPGVDLVIAEGWDLERFFENSPAWNPAAADIRGVVCGVRVEEIADPLMRRIRYLDKLVDELARGKALEAILSRARPAAT